MQDKGQVKGQGILSLIFTIYVGGIICAAFVFVVQESARFALKAAAYYIPLWLQIVIISAVIAMIVVGFKKKEYRSFLAVVVCFFLMALATGTCFAYMHYAKVGDEKVITKPGTVGSFMQRVLPPDL